MFFLLAKRRHFSQVDGASALVVDRVRQGSDGLLQALVVDRVRQGSDGLLQASTMGSADV